MVSALSSAGVGGGDQVGPCLLGRLTEKGVAQDAGGLLHAVPGAGGLFPHVALCLVQLYRRQHPPVGQTLRSAAERDELFHKFGVSCGIFSPQAVVIVGGGEREVQDGPQVIQGVEQADGVSPAGHGAQDMGCPGAGGRRRR